MPEILTDCQRKARKDHKCSYCGGKIPKGTVYDHTKLKSDYLYEWRAHPECSFIAGELCSWIDPDDGMTPDDFQYGCAEFCDKFVCPVCENYNKEDGDCLTGERYCAGRIHSFLQTHNFTRVKRDGWGYVWVCEPKETGGEAE